ncbi:hypothetical protein ACFQVD_35740 [Streptosporangium amethystogenes subsp. fukuiense]|uniref:Uncharacterized protein n=1 Tax=Streptosporangium amethystogenes subsp. fukuiense TaxID=698418 RepID=A0ABW2T9T6_9ACTN
MPDPGAFTVPERRIDGRQRSGVRGHEPKLVGDSSMSPVPPPGQVVSGLPDGLR